jgi:hypothetical protein
MSAEAICKDFPRCRGALFTTQQFMKLGGEQWDRSTVTSVGLEATRLYAEIFGKKNRRVRSSTAAGHRGMVGKYPCGIIAQAYRNVIAKKAAQHSVAAHGQVLTQT